MASGLLKYIGRSSEAPPREEDEAFAERIKARMERMGMVDNEVPKSPKIPTRGTLNQVSSNRRIVADQARVTPRSLKLTRGTSHAPGMPDSKWKASNSQTAPSQRRGSFSVTQHKLYYSGSEGGMFDTDAENLDSTTHISEVGEEPLPHARINDDLGDVSGNVFQDRSEDEESLLPLGADNVRRRAHPRENLKTESIDVEASSSDDDRASSQDSIDGRPQRVFEATQDMLQEPRESIENPHITNTPASRQRAIGPVFDSPSIEKSLAYRGVAGREKQSQTTMSSIVDATKPAVKASAHKIENGETRYLENTYDWSPPEEPPVKAPMQPDIGDKVIEDLSADKASEAALKHQRPQFQQALRFESVQGDLQYPVQRTSLGQATSQTYPKKEPESLRSGPFGQQKLRMEDLPTMTTGKNGEMGQLLPAPAQIEQQELSQTSWQEPELVSKEGLGTRRDIPVHLPVQLTVHDKATPSHSHFSIPQYRDTERLEGHFTSKLPPTKDTAVVDQKKLESRKRALELDYTPVELSGMTYMLLDSESFDHIPKRNTAALPANFGEASLIEKTQHAYNLRDDDDGPSRRQIIFMNLSIEQYEEAGDILLDKISDVIKRYREARRSRRMVAKELEKEVTQREALVRGKMMAVEDDLIGLRQAGQKVVQGKYS